MQTGEAAKLGKPWTEFGKICPNLSLKFVVLIIGEIEHKILCTPATFCWCEKKIDEIDTGRQFHQCFLHVFCTNIVLAVFF